MKRTISCELENSEYKEMILEKGGIIDMQYARKLKKGDKMTY